VGYDVQFVQIPATVKVSFPVDADRAKVLLEKAQGLEDPDAVRSALLELEGCRPGPGDAVDYLGPGLNYARLFVRNDVVHVENNCSARELLKIYGKVVALQPALLILDLQSRQLHNAESYREWWSRPL